MSIKMRHIKMRHNRNIFTEIFCIFASSCIEKQKLMMQLGKEGGVAADLLRDPLIS